MSPALPSLSTVLPAVRDTATLPWRLSVAAVRTTLQLGHLSSPDGPVRRPGGYAERLALLGDLAAPDRPLGRLLERDGMLDRLLAADGPLERLLAPDGPVDRLLAVDGALEQLVAPDGLLERLLAQEGALDRLTAPGGVLEQLLAPGGLADRLLDEEDVLLKLISDGGTLDQLVTLGGTLESIRPQLVQLSVLIPKLSDSAEALHQVASPLGDLAGRLPLSRRRTTEVPGRVIGPSGRS